MSGRETSIQTLYVSFGGAGISMYFLKNDKHHELCCLLLPKFTGSQSIFVKSRGEYYERVGSA
jgi:hypothetical protein